MNKDGSEKFHANKGESSGIDKEEELIVPPDTVQEYLDISDKYSDAENQLDYGVRVKHPNRNTSKGEDIYKAKEIIEENNKTKNAPTKRGPGATLAGELPGILTKEIFIEIATYRSSCCISIYCDTHALGVDVNERFDTIAFKNILYDLAIKLRSRNLDPATIEKLLKPGFDLIQNDKFWVSLSQGLAIFIAENYFKFIKMPVRPENDVVCDATFFVSPLIPIIASPEYYYLLIISKQKIKLFRGNKFGVEFIPVTDLPDGITEVTRIAEKKSSTRRMGARGGTGGANFHGMSGEPDHKTAIASYLEAVDDILYKNIFNKENAPLLLAGVEYLIPIYRSICDYHNVCKEELTGSYEQQPGSVLHAAAMKVMAPFFDHRKNKAKELFANNIATALTSSMVHTVVPASYYGRVSHLFVRKGAHIPGFFDETNNELHIHEKEEAGSEDLIDNAVEKTFLTGGEVFLVDAEEMPSEADVAAVFRY